MKSQKRRKPLKQDNIRYYKTTKPRYRIDKSGRGMVCGLQESDLNSLITGAALHFYDGLEKAKQKLIGATGYDLESATESILWFERMLWLTRSLGDARSKAVDDHNAMFGIVYEPRLTPLKERLLRNKRNRETLKKIWAASIEAAFG